VIPVKRRHLLPAFLVTLLVLMTVPALLHADTVYHDQPGATGIQSTTGTIVRETDDRVEVMTADGQTVSIDRDDVFQIVRDAPRPQGDDRLEDFPGAAALARRGTVFDDTDPGSTSGRHYGFKGGMNVSNVRADPQELEDRDSLRGYAMGFWFGVPVWRHLTIQTEALFTMKGDSESASGYTASTHLGYFELPVLARVDVLRDALVRPFLLVGPSLAVNVSASSELESDGSTVEVDVKDQVGSLDLGLVVGGGLDFALGGRTVGLDVRYTRGLTDVGDGVIGSARNESITVMSSIGLR
jgi:hypothetical protein